ncbi:MAG: hypothetical protein WCS65_16045, partial [Verrucomicrobiae bacterium]
MKQLKDMLEEKKSARYRYWVTPPEFLTLRIADIEASIPRMNWKPGSPTDGTFDLPAAAVFSRNVPRISLRELAEILPDHVLSSDGSIKLPAARLTAAYHLVPQREELPPEPEIVPPSPEAEEIPSDQAPAVPDGWQPPSQEPASDQAPAVPDGWQPPSQEP